jgi:hypothetical protein
MTEKQAEEKYGAGEVKVYKVNFAKTTARKPKAESKASPKSSRTKVESSARV